MQVLIAGKTLASTVPRPDTKLNRRSFVHFERLSTKLDVSEKVSWQMLNKQIYHWKMYVSRNPAGSTVFLM